MEPWMFIIETLAQQYRRWPDYQSAVLSAHYYIPGDPLGLSRVANKKC